MLKRCACNAYDIDDECSNYVRDNHDGTSTPFCPPWTCAAVKLHRAQGLHYPHGDPGDEMPDEVYSGDHLDD